MITFKRLLGTILVATIWFGILYFSVLTKHPEASFKEVSGLAVGLMIVIAIFSTIVWAVGSFIIWLFD